MVTGGSGSLGRAACQQLIHQELTPVVYSRDRSRQRSNCPGCILEIGDVQDIHCLLHVMKKHDVCGVVHAAAFKHVDVCQLQPSLAVSSIVGGTLNVLRAIEMTPSVRRAILVSSDKACHADQVYGTCKRLGERMTEEFGDRLRDRCKVNSMRLGNLFGSSGSVLTIWMAEMRADKTVTLHTFGGRPGFRLAMLPSEAAQGLIDCFVRPSGLENGSVLAPRHLPKVNMRTVAEALKSLTSSASHIETKPAAEGEARVENLFLPEELSRVRFHDHGVAEMFRCNTGAKAPGEMSPVLNLEETRTFISRACAEMAPWT